MSTENNSSAPKIPSPKPLPTKPYTPPSVSELKASYQAKTGGNDTLNSSAPALAIDPSTFSHVPELLEWLRPVEDPEMFISIIELGLVYDTKLLDDGKKATALMTLTSPHCPVADMFVENVRKRLLEYPGVVDTEVKLVFEPKWDPREMASDEVKDRLGIW